jgi:hypothetical protein
MAEGIVLEGGRGRLGGGGEDYRVRGSDWRLRGRQRRELRDNMGVGSQREESYGMCCRIAVRRCWRRGLGLLKSSIQRGEGRGRRKVTRGAAAEGPLLDVTLQPWSYAPVDMRLQCARVANPELLRLCCSPDFSGITDPFYCTYICLSLPY